MPEEKVVKEVKKLTIGQKFKKWYRGLPESKKYIEFFSAILGIPVLLTVLILNYNNLKGAKTVTTIVPTPPSPPKMVVTVVPVTQKESSPTATPIPACKKEVGPIEISSPTEGQTVNSSPVCFNIDYKDNSYCSVVWKYRIDNSSWSDFIDKSVCVYNLTSGPHTFELNVKSTASSDTTDLIRNFNFQGGINPTPTNTPTLSPTPTPTQ